MLIRSFERRDQDAARRLIVAGLGEHFGWIDETRNPDLNDIAASYIECGHTFLIAEIDSQVVGTAALITEAPSAGRIVRVSVSRLYRRRGIGRVLVMHILGMAKKKSLKEVRVSTDYGWEDAIGLYRHCGFDEYQRDVSGVHFVLILLNDRSGDNTR